MTTLNITFPVDLAALRRKRWLALVVGGMTRYEIPPDAMFDPVRQFAIKYQTSGYRFRLVTLLHATAVKMLLMPKATNRRKSLFATGGLYLALDDQHTDLRIRQSFGDFTSSFSHQIGVGLAIIAMSEAFDVKWDQLVAIPVGADKVLDYQAPLPGAPLPGTQLQIEAKGTTSAVGRSSLARAAYRKKLTDPKNLKSTVSTFSPPIAMLAVITEMTQQATGQGVVQIIDPKPKRSSLRFDDSFAAGRYLHYAGVARFAGLNLAAEELDRRARQRMRGRPVTQSLRSITVPQEATYVREGQTFGGIQWRLGEAAASETWFYQAADLTRLNSILGRDEFPDCQPINVDEEPALVETTGEIDVRQPSSEQSVSNSSAGEQGGTAYIESILPDGSYFGIGTGPRVGFRAVDVRSLVLDKFHLDNG